jgi:hypothetical protein
MASDTRHFIIGGTSVLTPTVHSDLAGARVRTEKGAPELGE